jgi:hypothetical protein
MMAYEIDHIFVLTDVGAPCAEALLRFGLTEGEPKCLNVTGIRPSYNSTPSCSSLGKRERPGRHAGEILTPSHLSHEQTKRHVGHVVEGRLIATGADGAESGFRAPISDIQ